MTSSFELDNIRSEAETENGFRALPSVSSLLEELSTDSIDGPHLTTVIRQELDLARDEISRGLRLDVDEIRRRCERAIALLAGTRLDPVINGTGIVLHTNLGRAPVSSATADAMAAAASSYLSLEMDPETNLRGGRMEEISRLMRVLTGAESTLVVNNNAAAVLLSLTTLASGRDVIVSRGEAVEIGGGFRIPEVIAQSGCRLVEVGTTNRTYAADYRNAIGASSGVLLKVHTSNFRIEGFTAATAPAELAVLASEFGLPLVEDLGSGALLSTSRFGLRHEPLIGEALSAGASIVASSGDKLLGGPQSGLIVGQTELVQRIERHPMARALRVDKVTLAGLAATLRHYIAGNPETEIPIWRMISASEHDIAARARAIAEELGVQIEPTMASVGGGSLPGETIPSTAVAIHASDAGELARKLRTGSLRIFPIIRDGIVLIDMRTVLPEHDAKLLATLFEALR